MSSLSVIVYQSRAVRPLADVDLFYLLAQARDRNKAEGVSGLLIYDRGRFYQWIEGDERFLRPIWNSIRVDFRHTDVDVLTDQRMPFRIFATWSMQFAHRDKQFGNVMEGFAQADALLLDDLHSSPDSVPRNLASFSTVKLSSTQ